jgi:hypothetical protein
MKVVLGAFNKECLIKSMNYPGFVWSRSPTSLNGVFEKARSGFKRPVMLSMDGSAFDST